MSISFKDYIYRLQNDFKLVATQIERGEYDAAVRICDEWLNGGALFQKPLSSGTYFQCVSSLFYFRAQALLGKLNLMLVQSETKLESLLEEFKETVAKFNFNYAYSGWIYRKKMKPFRDMLIVDFCYIMSDEYTFNDWLEECLSIIEAQKKRHGKKNKLIYGELLIYVARGMFKKATEKNEIIGLMKELLLKAMDLYQKYDPHSFKVNEINMLLEQIQATSSNIEINIEQVNEILRTQAQQLNDDSVNDSIFLLEKARVDFSQNYMLAIQSINNNSPDDMLIYAKQALNIGTSYLSQLQATYGLGVETRQVMLWLTNIYILLFNSEKDRNYLISAINLWEKVIDEFRCENRKNRRERFSKMSKEELHENIDIKDILAAFGDGLNYNPIEATGVITAEVNKGICHILLGDIQQGLNCKKDVEHILEFNDDFFDEKESAFLIYPLYINLAQYYSKQHQQKDAEDYHSLSQSIKDMLIESEYRELILVYDQLASFDV